MQNHTNVHAVSPKAGKTNINSWLKRRRQAHRHAHPNHTKRTSPSSTTAHTTGPTTPTKQHTKLTTLLSWTKATIANQSNTGTAALSTAPDNRQQHFIHDTANMTQDQADCAPDGRPKQTCISQVGQFQGAPQSALTADTTHALHNPDDRPSAPTADSQVQGQNQIGQYGANPIDQTTPDERPVTPTAGEQGQLQAQQAITAGQATVDEQPSGASNRQARNPLWQTIPKKPTTATATGPNKRTMQ